jgi:hypothetical protein
MKASTKAPKVDLEEHQQRLLAYDYLMWHLGGREKPRTVYNIANRIGIGYRKVDKVIERALFKCRRDW